MLELTVDAVLFDSDGVMVDSHEQVLAAWSQLASEFDLDLEVLVPEVAGVPAGQTLAKHLSGDRLAAAVARLEHIEVAAATGTTAIPGAVELLASLPAQRLGFVTSASARLARARWAAAGIPLPPTIVTADDVKNGKPHPEPYTTGAATLGVSPSRCLVVEDSRAGGASGVAAGAPVLAVGPAEWDVHPVARVPDLSHVSAKVVADACVIRIRPTG